MNRAALISWLIEVEGLAVALDRPQRGHELAGELRQRLAGLRAQYWRDTPLRVFTKCGISRCTPSVAGKSSVMRWPCAGRAMCLTTSSCLLRRLGIESVLQHNPEVIIVSTQAQLDAWRIWPQIDAVKHGRLLLLTDKGLERPSGQMLEATAKLCEQLAALTLLSLRGRLGSHKGAAPLQR